MCCTGVPLEVGKRERKSGVGEVNRSEMGIEKGNTMQKKNGEVQRGRMACSMIED